jgi:tyrosyl-tRNA synthetase
MGGSDQWGNIVQGVELCRRVDGREVLGVTQPLLMTANGQKMGKTATGAVWLDGDLLAPFDFWQFWRNVDDADVEPLLKRMTDLPLDEIARLAALQGAEINIAKIALANAATAMLHGQAAADLAQATASQQFGGTAGDGGEAQGLPEFALMAKPNVRPMVAACGSMTKASATPARLCPPNCWRMVLSNCRSAKSAMCAWC